MGVKCEICGWEHEDVEHVWVKKPDYEVNPKFVSFDKRTKAGKAGKVAEATPEEPQEEALDVPPDEGPDEPGDDMPMDGAARRKQGTLEGAERRRKWREEAMAKYKKGLGGEKK